MEMVCTPSVIDTFLSNKNVQVFQSLQVFVTTFIYVTLPQFACHISYVLK